MKILIINARTLKIVGLFDSIVEIVKSGIDVSPSNISNFLNQKQYGKRKMNSLGGYYFLYINIESESLSASQRKYIENKARIISTIKDNTFVENFNDKRLKQLWG